VHYNPTFSSSIKVYVIAFIVFFAIDIVWLSVISKNLYAAQLGHLMSPRVNWLAALLFYLVFLVGLVFFVINPALVKGDWLFALLAGGFFGLVTYATYDMTNLATLKDWPVLITVVDLLWGTALNGITAVVTYLLARWLVV